MKKKLGLPLIALILGSLFILTVCAEGEALLSPGIRVLAGKQTMVCSGICGEEITFTAADFEKVLGYVPASVTVTALPDPADGVLKLGVLEITAGSTLSRQTLSSLRFVPRTPGVRETSFSFTAEYGSYRTDIPLSCRICMTDTENLSPLAADAELSTYTAVSVMGRLFCEDPEGDACSYEIVRAPRKGEVSLDGENGSFVYTPAVGKKGTDAFTYRVTDAYGNESEICRVVLEIRRPKISSEYADLSGHWAACAAIRMAEEELMTGRVVGGSLLFSPDESVSRADFLVMAMKAAGTDPVSACDATVFADDEKIPACQKGYVNAAYGKGIVAGTETDGTLVFEPDRPVTRAEAAVIVDRLLGLSADMTRPVSVTDRDPAIPAWCADAVGALCEAKLLAGTGNGYELSSDLTRAQAAALLSAVLDYRNK